MRTALLTIIGCMSLAGCSAAATQASVPLPRAAERPTPLHFGLYVTPDPAQNPIDPPERFTGYHSATDFELFPGEEDARVPVRSICAGMIRFSGFAEGYGGLVSQECTLQNQAVTVLYGHLSLDSLPKQRFVATGATIGRLGAANTRDTDGSRKHLHLGIRKGHVSDVRGYVQDPSELEMFLDPQTILHL